LTIATLLLALIVGGLLRFASLGAREMSADEGASWAAASAPTIGAVLRAQHTMNPGEAGLHDVALHLWMRGLGDRLAILRALSAAAGTLAILLVFGAARELFLATAESISSDHADREGSFYDRVNDAAALAALVFAVNLVTIKYSREARMYPFALAAVVAQTWCFFRAMRCGGFAAYTAVAILTAMAEAAHLATVLAFTGEGLWLAYAIARTRFDFAVPKVRRAFALLIALGAGAAMLALIAPTAVTGAAHAAGLGTYNWIELPQPWAPFALFNKATGTVAFPLMLALAAWGIARGWRRWRDPILFSLLWMWAPPIVMVIVSYAVRPIFVERYLISSFVPFFILIAIGIVEIPWPVARIGVTALVAAVAIGHVVEWDRKPHDTQWSEAAQIALASITSSTPANSETGIATNSASSKIATTTGATLAVAPGYAIDVVRYYLGNPAARLAHFADLNGHDPAPVIIVGDQGVTAENTAALESEYPRVLAHLRAVVVRGR
jgi:hypothetical protein